MGCTGSKKGSSQSKTGENQQQQPQKTTQTLQSLAQTNRSATVHIVFAGDPAVGKTSIITRWKDGTFSESTNSTQDPGDQIKRNVVINGETIELRVCDTGGQERFTNITSSYYRFADIVILVYDVSVPDSFAHLRNWVEQVKRYCPDTCIMMIVGNKIDLPRQVQDNEAAAFAQELGAEFVTTSAKDGTNIEKLFEMAPSAVLKHKAPQNST